MALALPLAQPAGPAREDCGRWGSQELRACEIDRSDIDILDAAGSVPASRLATTLLSFNGILERLTASAYERFGEGRHPAGLNFGDCMTYAVARHRAAPLLFKGADFARTDLAIHPASKPGSVEGLVCITSSVRPEPVEGPSFLFSKEKERASTSSARTEEGGTKHPVP